MSDHRAPNTLLGDLDLHLLGEGRHHMLYNHLGAHPASRDGLSGTIFGVWAPNAERVAVIGDWNEWDGSRNLLRPRGASGVWEGFVPGAARGMKYKFRIHARTHEYQVDKADPFAVQAEVSPKTASIIWDLDYTWHDDAWMACRRQKLSHSAPVSIYELHLGSWRRPGDAPERLLGYRELAPLIAEHVQASGFTHVELLPVMEHPFYGSWGYQVTGYFAPTSRYGSPQDFMYFVDYLHQRGIGVILDWVPSHFPTDGHGLGYFDGTHLFEHADPRNGFHPDWQSYIFNYGRNEVRAFLVSSARYWIDKFHIDGLRVDAVASMLYLDYSRPEGEWIPNEHGGRENLQAISVIKETNESVYSAHPEIQTIAEESTSWPKVSRPTSEGGLGFGFKWDMGWMHDTLKHFSRDPIHRRFHHHELTFRGLYAFTENFVLALSHDEVVHGKGSLLRKMPGDDWQRFANLRLLYGYMWTQPGKKLLFMGGEFGQWSEWNHDASLDWHLLSEHPHAQLLRYVSELNRLYRAEAALHELDCEPAGFEWISADDAENGVLVYARRGLHGAPLITVLNLTPIVRADFRVGVTGSGGFREILNSDQRSFGGSGVINEGRLEAEHFAWQGREHSLRLTLPPLGMTTLKPITGG